MFIQIILQILAFARMQEGNVNRNVFHINNLNTQGLIQSEFDFNRIIFISFMDT